MEQFFEALANNIVIVVIGTCFLVGMVLKAITTMTVASARERSRREIAAYIAEGSINPEQGERLMRADINRGPRVS